jgi:four helix bundle protein
MALQVAAVSLELITAVRPLVGRVRRYDRSLADQLVRAASSVSLNIGEARYSDPGNERARLHRAAGSAGEVRVAPQVAIAWGYFAEVDAAPALALVDRVVAMLWRLTRR